MLLGETFAVALGALRANKLRSFLTMLGIVIGVGAVIAMIALGRGAQQSVQERISALGTTLLTVMPGQAQGMGGVRQTDQTKMTPDDALALQDRAPSISAVQPEMRRGLQLQYQNKNTNSQIIGTSANYLEVRKYELAAGRMFTQGDDDGKRRLAVVGPTVLTNLGFDSPQGIIGEQIRIRGIMFEVIGVLKSKGQTGGFQDPDDQVLVPLNTARYRLMGTNRLNSINVLARSEQDIPQTMAEIQQVLRREHKLRPGKDDDFQIRNQSDFLNTAAETAQTFGFLLAGIAAVSLLVGGIGIMNIMLVSVTERTREIGIRKSLGATKRNILLQFLIEAVVLCLLGGIVGIGAGVGSALLLATKFGWSTQLSADSILLSFVFSALVGVLFGVWPARRAAGLDPILALRYE